MAKFNLSPFHRRVIKTVQEGGYLVAEEAGFLLHDSTGKFISSVSELTFEEIATFYTWERRGVEVRFKGQQWPDESKEDQPPKEELVVEYGDKPLPVPMMIATACMVQRRELLKLQQFPLSEEDQRAVVNLVGDLIEELRIKGDRIKELEGTVTAVQNFYGTFLEARRGLNERAAELGQKLAAAFRAVNPEGRDDEDE